VTLMSDFLNIADQTPGQLRHMLEVGFALRDEREAGKANRPVLAGRGEKP